MQENSIGELIGRLSENVFNPIIMFLFGLALVFFLWGVARYFFESDSDAARQQGSRHMIYGILGMFVMFAVFAILRLVAGTIGADIDIP